MKSIIFTLFLILPSLIINAQNDGTTISVSDLETLESLSELKSLKGIKQLVNNDNGKLLIDLSALSALEGLASLEGLKGLEALESLEDIEVSEIIKDGRGGHYEIRYRDNYNSDRALIQKEHKIAMTSGTISIEGLEEVRITGYNGSEVIMRRSSDDEEHDDRAKGLRAINSLGVEDNTGLGVHAILEGDRLTVVQVSKSCCEDDFEIKVPHGINIDISNSAVGAGDIMVADIKDEVVISTNYSDVSLKNVSGPLAIKSVYGSIEATMKSISQEGSINLYSVYDIIDLTLPASAKTDIELTTPYGEIYTDMDIAIKEKSSLRKLSSKEIIGTTNGGGVSIALKSGYDNIYLRKN